MEPLNITPTPGQVYRGMQGELIVVEGLQPNPVFPNDTLVEYRNINGTVTTLYTLPAFELVFELVGETEADFADEFENIPRQG